METERGTLDIERVLQAESPLLLHISSEAHVSISVLVQTWLSAGSEAPPTPLSRFIIVTLGVLLPPVHQDRSSDSINF